MLPLQQQETRSAPPWKGIIAKIPYEVPEDELALEVATALLHDRELVPDSLPTFTSIEDVRCQLAEIRIDNARASLG